MNGFIDVSAYFPGYTFSEIQQYNIFVQASVLSNNFGLSIINVLEKEEYAREIFYQLFGCPEEEFAEENDY